MSGAGSAASCNLHERSAMTASDPRIELLWRNLAKVIDPEIGIDIVALGLVYGVEVHDDVAWITHTLTTPGCPMERIITDGIRAAAMEADDICGVETTLVWEPTWHSGMIAPGAL
jgi:metal-sulfur cluster biosynthetic enzyme